MAHLRFFTTPVVATAVLLFIAVGCNRKSDAITGQVFTATESGDQPLSMAQIRLTPLAPAADGADAPEEPANLQGVEITNGAGAFEIADLASNQTFQEYGLLRDWRYELRIQSPGYYIYRTELDYEGGTQPMKVTLKMKPSDVADETGVIDIPDGAVQMGPVRRHR